MRTCEVRRFIMFSFSMMSSCDVCIHHRIRMAERDRTHFQTRTRKSLLLSHKHKVDSWNVISFLIPFASPRAQCLAAGILFVSLELFFRFFFIWVCVVMDIHISQHKAHMLLGRLQDFWVIASRNGWSFLVVPNDDRLIRKKKKLSLLSSVGGFSYN